MAERLQTTTPAYQQAQIKVHMLWTQTCSHYNVYNMSNKAVLSFEVYLTEKPNVASLTGP